MATKIAYHIILYYQWTAECDCLHMVPISLNSVRTVHQLLRVIESMLKDQEDEKYGKFYDYLNNYGRPHEKQIRFGPKATSQEDTEWTNVTQATQPVNTNDFVLEHYNIDSKEPGCFFILINDSESLSQSPTNNETTNVPKTEPKIKPKPEPKTTPQLQSKRPKRRRKRKRMRTEFESKNNEDDDESMHKNKKKRQKIGRLATNTLHECMWLLTDASLNGLYQIDRESTGKDRCTVDKMDLVRNCIEEIVKTNWPSKHCNTHYIALHSFGRHLMQICDVRRYSERNASLILEGIDSIQYEKTNCGFFLSAIGQLINIIENKKRSMQCHHRIVLFVSRNLKSLHGASSTVSAIHKKLKCNDIMFDVIQVSRMHRPNQMILELIKDTGKLWSPSDSKEEWDNVVTCDFFVKPESRSLCYEDAIVLSD
eukprot:203565_1